MKYIFFDWGYTLISGFHDVDEEVNTILKKYDKEWKQIFKTWKNYQMLLSLGRLTEEELFRELELVLQIDKIDLISINELLLESYVIENETKDIIKKLYKDGYYLGIISNNSIHNIHYILEKEKLFTYFHKIVISEEVKERKPNLKIYMEAFKDISAKDYADIYFISDEVVEDLITAKILGVNTVWLQSDVENEWKKKEEICFIQPDYKITQISDIIKVIGGI